MKSIRLFNTSQVKSMLHVEKCPIEATLPIQQAISQMLWEAIAGHDDLQKK